jgi:hypothetical protein
MRKQLLWIQLAVMLAVVVFSGVCALSQENVKAVDDSAFAERMRPKAVFFHEDHNQKAGIEECNKCHHVYNGTKLVEDESSEDKECSACHLSRKGESLLNLADLYHRQCKGCHVENKKGPIMCNECHVRK